MFVKICGLTTSAAVTTAAEAGADAVGFVFADSPRQVTPQQAAALSRELPAEILRVAVMRQPTPADWATVRHAFDPDWLQADAGAVAAFRSEVDVRILPVYRDTPQLHEAELAAQSLVLFEGQESGHGERVDWHRAGRLAARTRLILAGGLDPENVADAISRVRPFGVDVSSGVERARGIKDLGRIRAFVAAVREAERAHAD